MFDELDYDMTKTQSGFRPAWLVDANLRVGDRVVWTHRAIKRGQRGTVVSDVDEQYVGVEWDEGYSGGARRDLLRRLSPLEQLADAAEEVNP